MQEQEDIHQLEKTASLIGVIILLIGILNILGLFHDSHVYILLLILGILMNVISAVRDHKKGYRLLQWAEIAAACACLGGTIWLLLF